MVCTAKASATPSITAQAAAALRQGWWRSSCRDQVRSKASMGRLWRCSTAAAAHGSHAARFALHQGQGTPRLEVARRGLT